MHSLFGSYDRRAIIRPLPITMDIKLLSIGFEPAISQHLIPLRQPPMVVSTPLNSFKFVTYICTESQNITYKHNTFKKKTYKHNEFKIDVMKL